MRPGPAAGPGGSPGRVTVRRLDGENAAGYAEAARQACLDLLSTDLLPRLGPSGAAILTGPTIRPPWSAAGWWPPASRWSLKTASGWPTIP
jgi:hypothetical protein